MGSDRTGPYSNQHPTERLTVADAADALGISAEAVRMRIRRGTLRSDRSEGTVYVILDANQTRHDTDATRDRTGDRAELVEELRDRVASLERQLEQERQANSEHRRLLAAALERIPPQLEAPESPESEASPGPTDTPTDTPEWPQAETSRPWWRRMFGG